MGDSASTDIASRLLPIAAALLALGGVLVVLGGFRVGPAGRLRLWTAYATEFGILGAILVPAYLGTAFLLLTCMAIAALATRELYGTLRAMGGAPSTPLGALVGTGLLVAAAFGGESALYALVFSAVVPVVLVAGLLRRRQGGTISATAATLLGIVYPSALLAHVLLLRRLDGGFGYVVLLFCLIEINDSFALLVGTLVGGPRLWPRVSPNKTVAGSAAGLLATLAGVLLLSFAAPSLSTSYLLGAAALVAVLGQVGDLVASSIKREAGVKDFSRLVPAQGGLLDIYDALIFTTPAFYWYVRLVMAM